jgi:dynein heavy chain
LEDVNTSENFVALWAHEGFRVFPDQFVSPEDKDWFVGAVNRIACQVFGESFDQTLKEATSAPFCSFVADIPQCEGVDESKIPRIEERVSPFDALSWRCLEFMKEQNARPATKGERLDLVLFDDATNHLVRIARVVGIPRSHAMVAGLGGSGKQSTTRRASPLLSHQTFRAVPVGIIRDLVPWPIYESFIEERVFFTHRRRLFLLTME